MVWFLNDMHCPLCALHGITLTEKGNFEKNPKHLCSLNTLPFMSGSDVVPPLLSRYVHCSAGLGKQARPFGVGTQAQSQDKGRSAARRASLVLGAAGVFRQTCANPILFHLKPVAPLRRRTLLAEFPGRNGKVLGQLV